MNTSNIERRPTPERSGTAGEHGRWQVVAEGRKQVLELAARGAPIDEVLNALVRAAQAITDEGARAAIFITDPDGARLRFAAGAGLPERYTKAVDGCGIGPAQPSCGSVAYTGRQVIVRDVTTDPLWAPYLELAQEHGIRACWSFPLRDGDGPVLGTFALYHGQPCEPAPHQYDEIRFLANIAALAIARHKASADEAAQQQKGEERLKESNRRKDEFLAMLSHELRNPLAPIRYALPLLRREPLPESAARAVSVIERQLNQLTRLVDDLLDMSRVMRGSIELRREHVALGRIVSTAVETSAPAIAAAGHTVNVTVADEPIWLHADPARLAQVVTNLLDNSSKYTPAGGRITVTAAREGDDGVLRIRDNGIGIPPDALPTLFDMFYQVNRGDEAPAGLGIGLALARQLVEMHGGSIAAHSEGAGCGAEFVLRLPVAQQVERQGMAAAAQPPGTQQLRVLVVDDSDDLVEMLALLVSGLGHDVQTARDGQAAVTTAIAYRPDVVLLDLGLPVLSGLDVARELRQHPETANARLIAMTGWGQAEDRARTLAAGFDHHLTKPADPEALELLLTEAAQQ